MKKYLTRNDDKASDKFIKLQLLNDNSQKTMQQV